MRFGGLFRERSFYQSRAATSAYRGFRRAAAKAGLDVVLKTFYSPIPDLDALPSCTFERTSELPGLAWDLDAQLRYVQEQLAPEMLRFRPPSAANGAPWQYTPSDAYSVADATALYAIVR